MLKTVILTALCAVLSFTSPAEARHRHQAACIETSDIMRPTCGMTLSASNQVAKINMAPKAGAKPPALALEAQRVASATRRVEIAAQTIGGRPTGCPHAFCGCGASLHLFGRIIPSLNLAANWLRFPRAMPAPKMVAARRGHVFVLEQHIGGDLWLVHDSNSGGHRTRLHARSIAGYAIVNPAGGVS